MLYYVADPEATTTFFHSLLSHTGKLLIILVSGTLQSRTRLVENDFTCYYLLFKDNYLVNRL